eukprot:PhF_6_TR21068/c0_g1_i2/m.30346
MQLFKRRSTHAPQEPIYVHNVWNLLVQSNMAIQAANVRHKSTSFAVPPEVPSTLIRSFLRKDCDRTIRWEKLFPSHSIREAIQHWVLKTMERLRLRSFAVTRKKLLHAQGLDSTWLAARGVMLSEYRCPKRTFINMHPDVIRVVQTRWLPLLGGKVGLEGAKQLVTLMTWALLGMDDAPPLTSSPVDDQVMYTAMEIAHYWCESVNVQEYVSFFETTAALAATQVANIRSGSVSSSAPSSPGSTKSPLSAKLKTRFNNKKRASVMSSSVMTSPRTGFGALLGMKSRMTRQMQKEQSASRPHWDRDARFADSIWTPKHHCEWRLYTVSRDLPRPHWYEVTTHASSGGGDAQQRVPHVPVSPNAMSSTARAERLLNGARRYAEPSSTTARGGAGGARKSIWQVPS